MSRMYLTVGAQLLCSAVLVLSSAGQAEHRELYVRSTPDQQCPHGHLCLTLLHCLHNTSAAFTSNTTLHFLPGHHSAVWPHNTTLVVSNVSNLVLTGPDVGPGESPQASIWCNYTIQFHFRNTTDIAIRNLLFNECGTSLAIPGEDLFPSLFDGVDPPAALQFSTATNMTLEHVHIIWSHGLGLLALNSLDYCSITNCTISNNGRTKGTRIGGNAYFAYQLTEVEHYLTENVLKVSHSEISLGIMNSTTSRYMPSTGAGGMMIVVHNLTTQYRLDVLILSCTFHHNEAEDGANLRIDLSGFTDISLKVMDSTFVNGRAERYGLSLRYTGVFFSTYYTRMKVLVSNSTFLGHKGGGFYSRDNGIIYSLKILNSRFIDNSGIGAAINLRSFYYSEVTIVIYNSTFTNNRDGDSVMLAGGALEIYLLSGDFGHIKLDVKHCHFENNSNYPDAAGFRLTVNRECTQQSMSMSMYDTDFASSNGGHVALDLLIRSEVLITSCTFGQGGGSIYGGAIRITGILIKDPPLWQWKKVLVKITRTKFLDNSADNGGAISMMLMNEVTTSIYIIDCFLLRNTALYGGAIAILLKFSMGIDHTVWSNRFDYAIYEKVIIENTTFSENSAMQGAGVYISCEKVGDTLLYFEPLPLISVVIRSSRFTRNTGPIGASIEVYNVQTASGFRVSLYVTLSQFHSNVADHDTHNLHNTGIINVKEEDGVTLLIIENTELVKNNGSCIVVNGSLLTLKGKVTFTGNTAFAGAAILLDCVNVKKPSILNLQSNTTVLITNNTAWHFGGGIAINPECYIGKRCFYRAPCWKQFSSCTVYLEGNSALISGNSLYGPSASHCKPQPSSLFNIAEGFSANEIVLFDAYSVCICTKNSSTNKTYYELELSRKVRPGQEITLQAVVCTRPLTDNHNYAIRATVFTHNHTGHLGTRQNIQEVTKPCDTLVYSIFTTKKHVTLQLSHDTKSSTQSTSLQLTILPCPQGFQLDSTLKCNCTDYLQSFAPEISCNTTTNLITVPAGVWIGNYIDGKLAAHMNCPLDYCKAESFINLEQQDLQCTNSRSGVLCGACRAKRSLTMGTAKCVDSCSNYYLFLVIPLAMAGVLLVFMLLKCNLTVSVGTTNALIFYANTIHVNRTVFFSQNGNNLNRVLAVFIAWLNLDLGIDTCFYEGMTAYGSTWMQFVFPVYIWILTLTIIYTSRYSVTISKLIGRNSVHVLATLFLLSYAKLLRTVIAVVSPITLHDESGHTHLVWLMDGNVPFLRGKHAALFFVALLTALLYLLPLTLLTLLAPLLQARTRHPLLRWVLRIKPLLDAYQGPYKDKYRYWTGVMLTTRLVLFTVFAANTLGDPKINLFSIILAVLPYLLYITHISKNNLNVILECFYSLNLSVFASATLLLKGLQKDTEHLTWVMVGSVSAMFCFTLIWHIYMYVSIFQETLNKLKLFLKSHRRRQINSGAGQGCGDPVTPPPVRQPAPTTSVINMKDLREPLLTDN